MPIAMDKPTPEILRVTGIKHWFEDVGNSQDFLLHRGRFSFHAGNRVSGLVLLLSVPSILTPIYYPSSPAASPLPRDA